jgi:hypothetical protein
MELVDGAWTAEVAFAHKGLLQLRIESLSDDVPGWAEACLREFENRLPELEPRAWASILERYRWHGVPDGCPDPQTPEEMGELLVMDDVHLLGPGDVSLGYGLRPGLGWDDLMFTVEVEQWTVVRCQADD